MKQALGILCIFAILTGCQQSPETKFARDGISLTCPAGWKITDEDTIEGNGYCISIEKDGLNSSGLLSVSWFTDSVDPSAYMDAYMEEMKNNVIYKSSNINFEDYAESQFKNNPSLSVKYNMSLISVAHTGIIHILYAHGKTITILRQEAIEDLDKNKDGFELLEQSFAIE